MSRTTQDIGVAQLALSVSSAQKPDLFAVRQTTAIPLGPLCLVARLQPRQAPPPLHPLWQALLQLVLPVRLFHPIRSGK